MTALQALTMLDNRFIVRQSEHAAARLAAAERAIARADPAACFKLVAAARSDAGGKPAAGKPTPRSTAWPTPAG